MRVNLHTHSTTSDGRLSPTELIDKLSCNNIEVLALTDHDSISGLVEARNQAKIKGIKFINGIEISTKIHGLDIDFLDENHYTIHLLCLGFDYDILNEIFEQLDLEKKSRVNILVNELNKFGYEINDSDYGSKKTLVAQELVKKGYANNIQDAFNNIINKFYDKKVDCMTVEEVVKIIHKANGKVLWAHPYEILLDFQKVNINELQIDLICSKLKINNIDGIEVYYGNYSFSQVDYLKHIQKKYNFIASAGTDYHSKSDKELTYIDIDFDLIKEVIS